MALGTAAPWQGPIALVPAGRDSFVLAFPVAVEDLPPGTTVTYTVTAWDVANTPNAP